MHHAALRENDTAFIPAPHVLDSEQPNVPGRSSLTEVVWCNDPRQPIAMQQQGPRLGIAAALAGAHNAAERHRIVSALLHLIGFSTFAYVALELTRERVDRLFLHEAFIPPTYRGDYVRQRYHEIDPRTLGARRANAPMVWDLHHLREQTKDADLVSIDQGHEAFEGFLSMMRDDGMCSGLMFPMAIPGTRMHAFMSFTAPRRNRDWMTSTTIEQALSIGMSVHTFASSQLLAAARERSPNGLTPFERELLVGIAEGASDKEIGRRLDTSQHNVDYHLRKLRKRFNAANRIELTYLTSKLELI
ncbi:helix-turn-helix transcriptional regulator [Trinickia fusca]|uniref:LuxR family transcriptional regulator n=1 Tax=Trinickia fusca TaxID=2419777 RepID=A0A494XSU7_9BURK|nr:LuxR family transcriptional regulator [Trinickia fusca]RKP50623.1 LuxR family transcriptional regulator [Trinickia fusca]